MSEQDLQKIHVKRVRFAIMNVVETKSAHRGNSLAPEALDKSVAKTLDNRRVAT